MRLLALALVSAAFLGGCASRPAADLALVADGIPAGARTFAAVPPSDEASRAALGIVEERLRRFGYEPSATPDLLLEVSASERARGVGAFMPDACGASAWVAEPHKEWLLGGGKVLTLHVRLLDAGTSAPVYRSTASLRAGGGSAASHAAELAEAALPADPREAPKAVAPAC